jgi:hypothetical protein
MNQQVIPLQPLGRRERSRLRVRLLARLTTRTDVFRIILTDLSLTGAQFSVPLEQRAGTDAMLEWGHFEAFGELMWCDGCRCGMRFDEALTTNALIATRALNDSECLPSDFELARQAAKAWVGGST